MKATTQVPTVLFTQRHIDGLVFDATFEEVHTRRLETMTHATPNGPFIADHIAPGPIVVRITAGVSDTPLRREKNDSFSSGDQRSKQAFDTLLRLQEKGEPFSVQTGLKFYKNMVCTFLRLKQDKTCPRALFFQAELSQVLPGRFTDPFKLLPDSLYQQTSRLIDWGFRQSERFLINEMRELF